MQRKWQYSGVVQRALRGAVRWPMHCFQHRLLEDSSDFSFSVLLGGRLQVHMLRRRSATNDHSGTDHHNSRSDDDINVNHLIHNDVDQHHNGRACQLLRQVRERVGSTGGRSGVMPVGNQTIPTHGENRSGLLAVVRHLYLWRLRTTDRLLQRRWQPSGLIQRALCNSCGGPLYSFQHRLLQIAANIFVSVLFAGRFELRLLR